MVVLLAAGCMEMKDTNPYEGGLHVLTVAAQWPGDEVVQAEAEVLVEDMNTGSRYSSVMNIGGVAVFNLPNGLYRVNLSGRNGSDVFNASADKVVLSVGYNSAPVAEKSKKVHVIGDAFKVGSLRTVIWQAWDVAMKI